MPCAIDMIRPWEFRHAAPDPGPGIRCARAVRIEPLEPRRLFAAAPLFDESFNFGPANEPPVAGYIPDHGAVFGDQLDGLQYGWTVKENRNARLRH